MRKGPAFIGIGASFAGLTQVTTWLAEHDEIVDVIPSGNFFNTEAFTKKGLDWYEERICPSQGKSGLLCGDVSPGYLINAQVPKRIATSYSETKLFVIVRHPLKRALAAYVAHRDIDARAKNQSAATYLAEEVSLQTESYYADHLAHFSEYYAPVNLHIIAYEDLVADPLKVMSELYEYLEVTKTVIPKSLRHLAPPPEPPKNPGLIKRSIVRIKTAVKKFRERPIGPLFPPEPAIETLLSAEEQALFVASMRPSADRLSHIMGRDMVAFWNLE